jgi:Ni/Fe-hydrogenase subunit HybB-like protein
VLLIVKFYLLHMGDWNSKFSHRIGQLSFFVCLMAPGTLGLVFGMMAMRPVWYSPAMPFFFIISGFATACAFIVFFGEKSENSPEANKLYAEVLPRMLLVSILAVAIIRFGQIGTGLWSNAEGLEANRLALSSPFFHVEIWIGLVLPLLLLLVGNLRDTASLRSTAALFFLFGIFFARLEFLIVGQRVPLFRGSWAGYVSYSPSFVEWMLVPAGLGIFLFLYGVGSWALRLADAEKAKH